MRTLMLSTAAALALTAGAQARMAPSGDAGAARVAEPEVVPVQAEPEPIEGGVVVIEPEPEVAAEEPLREVDITDPDAPPIKDAENVIPERDAGDEARVPLLKAETGLTSPTHTAPTTAEGADAAMARTEGTATATGMMRPEAVPENFAVADMATMDVTQLLNVRVYDMTGDRIGEIDRWIGETPGRLPEAAVVDVGGVLGLGERQVAIDTALMVLMTDVDGNDMRVYVELTEEQLEGLPEVGG